MDDGLIALIASHVAVVVVGLAVLALARRRPRTAVGLVAGTLVAGFALVWVGAYLSDEHYEVGRRVYLAGILGVLYGLPAAVLFDAARRRTGDVVGPVTVRDWVNAVGAYLMAWWVTAFIVSGIAMLGMAQAGQMR